MGSNDVNLVLAHGAWAEGSSWSKVIKALAAEGIKAVAVPLPLTSFEDNVAALRSHSGACYWAGCPCRPCLCRRRDCRDAQ